MLNLLLDADTTYAPWITTSMPILRSIFVIIMLVCAITVIVICMCMESNPEGGSNVITGNTYESFYSQNKGSTREGRLKRLLIISSIITGVCAVLYFVTILIYPPII